ncbi:hypothetical protein SASPL_121059 [Salvia splendens]|uniref:Serine/threonine-protein kinase CTR1 n=2 Tax=Salvia splendens TaxID=180675 RepID=A0A8X8XRW5_SALSN|nr:hypothetical protein SASPL_121059 [Salvia splendens]
MEEEWVGRWPRRPIVWKRGGCRRRGGGAAVREGGAARRSGVRAIVTPLQCKAVRNHVAETGLPHDAITTCAPPPNTAVDGGAKSSDRYLRALLDRFESLEASHEKLKEQFQVVVHEKAERESPPDSGGSRRYPGWGDMPGAYFAESPYRRVLEYMGHALHVSRVGSDEIIYWNCAAEKLFGYKDSEVIGQGAVELLFDEEHHNLVLAIMERMRIGESWSGQLPLRKRSGQSFIALVTLSPLYEGEITGIVTASKVLSRTRGNVPSSSDTYRSARDAEEAEAESQDTRADRPPRAPFVYCKLQAVKILEKFQIGASSNLEGVVDERIQQNGFEDNSGRKEAANGTCSPIYSMQSASSLDTGNNAVDAMKETSDFPGTSFQTDGNKFVANPPNTKLLNTEDVDHEQLDPQKNPGSAESYGSGHGSSSSKGENDLPLVGSSAIQWEDLQLKEEIGKGSFAVLYRGIWNGSDVAVKVYTGSQYDETLLYYKKEIDIMRRLRHPNVLLFMGASCTEEKIAIATEYMTRGSLFKTLHRSNQSLDIRRRLRIALDVARGMNYLHHRNPPIVHRDLKSSNLLVDKSWNVKVGDFGLSKLKHSTFLTARSGRGTVKIIACPDVYSFGVVLWELMTERIPWSDLNALQVVGVVGFMNSRLDIPSSIDPQIASIISECWTSNSEDRPSFKDMIPKLADLLVQASGGGLNRAGSQT